MISLHETISEVSTAAQGCIITTAKFLTSSCKIAITNLMNHLKLKSQVNLEIVNNLITILQLITSFSDMSLGLLGRTGNNIVDVSINIIILNFFNNYLFLGGSFFIIK